MTTAVATDELRDRTLEISKRYKSAWIELGQHLFTIYKEKKYREWKYLSFETYCMKELHIKQPVASKLIKSYGFLEKEEPELVRDDAYSEDAAKTVPNYESVNLLRLAKENKSITPQEFGTLREAVLDEGREPKEVRAQVKRIIDEKDPRSEDERMKAQRNMKLRRVISVISNTQKELEGEKILPAYLMKQMSDLVGKLRDQLEQS